MSLPIIVVHCQNFCSFEPDLTLLVTFLPVNVPAPRLVKKLISKNVWVSFEPSNVGFYEGVDWITNKICKDRYILEAKICSCTNNCIKPSCNLLPRVGKLMLVVGVQLLKIVADLLILFISK